MAREATPPVDYTSRSYPEIRADLIDAIAPRVPEWTSRSPSDFGITLIEVFAQMGDMLSFYADRIANEAYLPTATQRASVLQLAKLLDYRPGGNIASQVELVFTNAVATPAVIPAGTTVSTTTTLNDRTISLNYETNVAVTAPANGTVTVLATEGTTTAGELLGTADGALDQRYPLYLTPVIDGSVRVYVNESGLPARWTYLEHIVDAGPVDTVYTLDIDANDVVFVVFGDGVNGKIPNPASVVSADYRVGGGTIGNVGPNTLTRIASVLPAGMSVNNQAPAYGGGNAESLDEIRINAPRSLFSLDRAVTLQDFANLALRVSGVAKAKAVSAVANSVVIYITPTGGGGLLNGAPTAAFTSLKAAVATYLSDKAPAATTVTIGNPSYVLTNVSVTVNALPQYSTEAVRQAVITALAALFDIDNVVLGDYAAVSDIYALMATVPGVSFSTVTLLGRQDNLPAPGAVPVSIQYAPHEVPTLGTVTVTVSGGIS